MRQIATTVPNWYTMDTCRRNQHWRLCCLFGISQKKSSRHNTIIFQFNQGFHCEVPSSHTYISNILLLCIYSPIQKGNPKFWQHYLKQDQKKLFVFFFVQITALDLIVCCYVQTYSLGQICLYFLFNFKNHLKVSPNHCVVDSFFFIYLSLLVKL